MKVYHNKNSKDPTFFIQRAYRDENGKSTTKNICRLGKYSELAAIHDDPVAYAKEYAEQLTKEEKETNTILVPFSVSKTSLCSELDGELEMASQPRDIFNVGYLYPSHVYTQCGMDKFFDSIKSNSKIKFDPDYINRMLCVSRIIAPASKLRTYNALSDLIEEPQKEIEYHQILRTLDVLCEHMDSYQEALYKGTLNVRERDTELIYYDCTNFYFEIEEEDEEFVHPVTGEIMPPLRRYGYSKEHRPNPLVQFGIMCDSDMIPIMMQVSPGSQNESLTAEPLERRCISSSRRRIKTLRRPARMSFSAVTLLCPAMIFASTIRWQTASSSLPSPYPNCRRPFRMPSSQTLTTNS